MPTVTVQIGTQREWAHFVLAVKSAIENVCHRVHFFGGSSTDDPWQNVCWVVEIENGRIVHLQRELRLIGRAWRQDSVAVTTGETVMV